MLRIPSHAVPWIILLIIILLILAFLGWLGYNHWSDLSEAIGVAIARCRTTITIRVPTE